MKFSCVKWYVSSLSMVLPFLVFGESMPDPTMPAGYSGGQLVREELPQELMKWDVRAIRLSDSGRIAVVNGRLVRIGDEIDSATVIDITAGTVVLEYDRKQLVLRLMPKDIKHRFAENMMQE